jgi:hypothetical protein
MAPAGRGIPRSRNITIMLILVNRKSSQHLVNLPHHHASPGRVAGQYYMTWVLDCQEVEICS